MKTAVVVSVGRTAVLQADRCGRRSHQHLVHVPTCTDCHSLDQGRIVIWRGQHMADLVMGDGNVVLPASISRIGFGELLEDAKGGLVAIERGRKVALCDEHSPPPL